MKKKKRRLKKSVKRFLTLVFAVVIILIAWSFQYNQGLQAVSSNTETVNFEVESGATYSTLADSLKENGLIKSKLFYKIYLRTHNFNNLQAGVYELSPNMGTVKILNVLSGGNTGTTVSITFREGLNMRQVGNLIEKNTNNKADDLYVLLKDDTYLNESITKYWFLTDEIKNPDIYYSLEGYLYPDTYQFASRDVSVEEIFTTMLDEMGDILNNYKSSIESSNYSVHELLTIASLAELEGIDQSSRKGIASVFYNRLNEGMSLGSDVTTYYASKVDMGERDLLQSELDSQNGYNTRAAGMEGKLPVGPIACVSTSSIDAAINPDTTDNLFFVADKNGKVYFTKTNAEHDAIIAQLQDEGLWYEW